MFFHDYHLYLAPRLVREQRPDALLAHFIHIPWPETDYWYVLPERMRDAIHEGLLANDIVGFHTQPLAAQLPALRARTFVGATVDHDASTRRRTTGGATLVTRSPDRESIPAEFDELAREPGTCSSRSGRSSGAAGEARRSRRPHRSVEECRARLPRVRALPRARIRRCTGA